LNTFNIFVELEKGRDADGGIVPIVKIGEIEMNDFKRYAAMFHSYRCVSVSSSPECLKSPKKRIDSTPGMDVYSFAMIMWELLHDKLPFDGNLDAAIEFVIDQDARPMIVTNQLDTTTPMESGTLAEINALQVLGQSQEKPVFTQDLANIIRRCWQTNPVQRPNFGQIYMMLIEQRTAIKADKRQTTYIDAQD